MKTFARIATVLGIAMTIVAATSADAADRRVIKSACSAGMMTCEAWCDKYRGGSSDCKFTHSGSCQNRYGNLKQCVGAGPPPNY